ncbi:MAG TPA: DUF1302 family protein, partial [Planctomycetes bacterium]|nr:DUF1302 family protein [Planctomycetota bacterium]
MPEQISLVCHPLDPVSSLLVDASVRVRKGAISVWRGGGSFSAIVSGSSHLLLLAGRPFGVPAGSLARLLEVLRCVPLSKEVYRMRGCVSPLARRVRLQAALLMAVFTLTPVFLGAIEFDLLSGKVSGHFDTTVSVGISWRVSDPDLSLIGAANGGTGNSLNGDDGNLNYDAGDIFSENLKVLHEISFDYDDYFVFIRGFYFSDFAIREGDVLKAGRPALSGTAERFAGLNAVLLDAYV